MRAPQSHLPAAEQQSAKQQQQQQQKQPTGNSK
jgi:hypothetical protein